MKQDPLIRLPSASRALLPTDVWDAFRSFPSSDLSELLKGFFDRRFVTKLVVCPSSIRGRGERARGVEVINFYLLGAQKDCMQQNASPAHHRMSLPFLSPSVDITELFLSSLLNVDLNMLDTKPTVPEAVEDSGDSSANARETKWTAKNASGNHHNNRSVVESNKRHSPFLSVFSAAPSAISCSSPLSFVADSPSSSAGLPLRPVLDHMFETKSILGEGAGK